MGDPLKVRQAALGLEVWANGTWDELEQLRAQLAAIGLLVDPATPAAIPGKRGRYRAYWRLHVRERA
jgi:hypothetical protein